MGKIQNLYSNILFDLNKVNGVRITALAGRDGYLLNEKLNDGLETITMMSSVMLRAAETFTNKFEKSCPDRIIVDYNGGKLITVSAGSKALISVVAAKDAPIDPIIQELERTAGKVKEIF
ncbi:MAG: hypothetical protein OIN87_09550 [Candidatus Methanoperedens sp.]|nr:hypothetical protein [Candidatus Methanoperedens sp.]